MPFQYCVFLLFPSCIHDSWIFESCCGWTLSTYAVIGSWAEKIEVVTGKVQVGYQEKFFSRGWSGTGTGSPGKWSQHQACWRSRSVWKTLFRHMSKFLGSPVWSLESDMMTPVGPFQPGVPYDSVGQCHLEGLRTFIELYMSEDEHSTSEMGGKIDLSKISASDRTTNEFSSLISWCGI